MRTTDFTLPAGFASAPAILAMGAELKSGFCLLHEGHARLSEIDGDLEQADVFRTYSASLEAMCAEHDFRHTQIAVDMHPDYLSTQLGERMHQRHHCPVTRVQHHHAHIAAAMAEYDYPLEGKPLLGIALDGLGFGLDRTIWGGEFLLAEYSGFTRLGRFQPVAMPGGAQAIREPWRNALAHLHACGWNDVVGHYARTDIVDFLYEKPLLNLQMMMNRGLNSPMASSAARLFDAAAACLDIFRDRVTYEGQAAIALETMAAPVFTTQAVYAYPYAIHHCDDGILQLDWSSMWLALLQDSAHEVAREMIAARFHQTVICAVSDLARQLCHDHHLEHVVLSGGVFQNLLLRHGVEQQLLSSGLQVLIPQRAPLHDGGLALGQAVIAAAIALKR